MITIDIEKYVNSYGADEYVIAVASAIDTISKAIGDPELKWRSELSIFPVRETLNKINISGLSKEEELLAVIAS